MSKLRSPLLGINYSSAEQKTAGTRSLRQVGRTGAAWCPGRAGQSPPMKRRARDPGSAVAHIPLPQERAMWRNCRLGWGRGGQERAGYSPLSSSCHTRGVGGWNWLEQRQLDPPKYLSRWAPDAGSFLVPRECWRAAPLAAPPTLRPAPAPAPNPGLHSLPASQRNLLRVFHWVRLVCVGLGGGLLSGGDPSAES